MAVICQPNCARRHPGCHDHCEEYAEKSSARKKQLEEYEAKNMNPYCFLCQLDVMLQSLTNWLSYAAIIVAVALALCQLIYFIIEKKENHHEHL